MKGKATVGIMLTLFLVATLFNAVPNVSASPAIKIGIFGPVGWTVGDGMWKGAELARDDINDAGGVLGHNIQLVGMADTLRGQADPDPTTGTLAMEELVAQDVDFAVGGFRTEAWMGARTVATDNQLISIITGSATDELIDCGAGTCGTCVRCDYATYKYMFRYTPINSSMLVRSLVGLYLYGIQGFIAKLLGDKLVNIYGNDLWDPHPVYGSTVPAVKVAVIAEEPIWATGIYNALTSFPTYAVLMGPFAKVVYSARVSAVATDVSTQLAAATAAGARLIIHILSGPVGTVFTNQWISEIPEADRPIIIGINVPGQDQPDHWTATGGNAEYEAFLATAGTRTPLNTISHPYTTEYWDAYTTAYGDAPVYTSYGVYDAVMIIAEAIQTLGHWPPTSQADYELLIPIIEQTDRVGLTGWFKFTGPSGTLHDVYCIDIGTTTTPPGYSRALIGQWQGPEVVQPEFPPGTPASGRLQVVNPVDQPYSRRFMLPPWYYPIGQDIGMPPNPGCDVNVDGDVNLLDALLLVAAFWATPGDPNWNIDTDIAVDGVVNLLDALSVVGLFWAHEDIPYP